MGPVGQQGLLSKVVSISANRAYSYRIRANVEREGMGKEVALT